MKGYRLKWWVVPTLYTLGVFLAWLWACSKL